MKTTRETIDVLRNLATRKAAKSCMFGFAPETASQDDQYVGLDGSDVIADLLQLAVIEQRVERARRYLSERLNVPGLRMIRDDLRAILEGRAGAGGGGAGMNQDQLDSIMAKSAKPKTGVELIAAERLRQVEKEGWDAGHDDEHDEEQLALAAACYSMPPKVRVRSLLDSTLLSHLWPWDREWWKPRPRDRIRELVKAGALIAAEIDRLQRLESNHAK